MRERFVPVEKVIANRVKEKSKDDGFHLKLGVEGGGLSATRTAGMVIALHELNALDAFDSIDPISAANFIVAFALSGNPYKGFEFFLNNHLFLDKFGLMKGKPVINISSLTDNVMNDLNTEPLINNPTVRMRSTSATDGSSRLLHTPTSANDLYHNLISSSQTPVLGGPPLIKRDGHALFDGGLKLAGNSYGLDDDNNTHELYLLTRTPGAKSSSLSDKFGSILLRAQGFPAAAKELITYEKRYAQKLASLHRAEVTSNQQPRNEIKPIVRTIKVRPTEPRLSMTTSNKQDLERGRDAGYKAVIAVFSPFGLTPQKKRS